MLRHLLGGCALFFLAIGNAWAANAPMPLPNANQPGAALYEEHCARCHDHPVDRIPPRAFLAILKTPEQVVTALTSGVMQPMAAGLKPAQVAAIATFVTGRAPGATNDPDPKANRCPNPAAPITLSAKDWNGWGQDAGNARFQAQAGLKAEDVPRLKIKWVFAYPGNIADSQPIIVDKMLLVANRAGRVFALDAQSGCTYWTFLAEGGVHAALTVGALPDGRIAAYVLAENGYLYALDARTGKKIWATRVEDHPSVRLTGSHTLHNGRLYVPLASLEEVSLFNPNYACCTFRGGVAAVDATTGKMIWKTHTIPREAKEMGVSSTGTKLFGPAGVAIFSAPTVDAKRKRIYVGTGNSYTQSSLETANAIMAFDMDSGETRWATQALADDNVCPKAQTPEECPKTGPDFDFAAPPVLRKLPNGQEILVAISKADEAFGYDPDKNGELLWRTKLGKGSRTAGVWGLTADDTYLYVGTADITPAPGVEVGGVTAVDFATGKAAWHIPAPPAVCSWGNGTSDLAQYSNGVANCSPAQPGALAAIPGVIFAGSIDGHMRAFAAKDGKQLWDFDTGKTFKAVNAPTATGGSLSNGVQAIADGMVFVNSGSGGLHQPGNALIAFSVDGR